MSSVALGLAIIALIGVLAIAFAVAELLRMVRGLQDGLRDVATRSGTPAREPDVVHETLRSDKGRRTIYFATSPDCPICAERLEDFAPAILESSDDLIVVSNRPGSEAYADGAITAIHAPEVVGQLAIQATPAVVVIDADGREVLRRVVAHPDAMRQVEIWLRNTSSKRQGETVS